MIEHTLIGLAMTLVCFFALDVAISFMHILCGGKRCNRKQDVQ
jgi:hypothetical protein